VVFVRKALSSPKSLFSYYPNLLTFTHHSGFGADAMTINESKILASKFTSFASRCIDRNYHDIPVYTLPNYLGISPQKWDSIVAIHLIEVVKQISFSLI